MTYSLNTLNSSSAGRSPQRQAPTGFAHELLLVLGLLALIFWLLSFLSYSSQDAAWSTTGSVANAGAARNWCGRFGALLADASYFLFGFSAWWAFAAGLRGWLASFTRWMSGGTTRRDEDFEDLPWWRTRSAFWIGFALLMCASTGLEWSRMYRFESYLPGQGGGVLGYLVGAAGTKWLGFTGSGLVGIVAMVAGIALVFRFSWGHVAERLGGWLYSGIQLRRARREIAQDMEAGRRAAQAREEEEEAMRRAGRRAEPVMEDDADDPVPVAAPAVRVRKGRADKRPSRATAESRDDDVEDVIDVSDLREIPASELAASAVPAPKPAPASDPAPVPAASATAASGPAPGPSSAAASPGRTAAPVPPVLDSRIDPWDDDADPLPWESGEEPEPAPASRAAVPSPAASAAPRRPAAPAPSPALVSAAGADHRLPQVDLLDGPQGRQETVAQETLDMTSRLIEKKLKDFGVQVRVVAAMPGPVITRYEIEPATGVKGSQVVNLAKDLARSLSLVSIRVIETIPGKNFMALELPNAKRQSIRLSEILGSQVYADGKSMLTMGLGKDIVGNPVVADLARMPHVLVAGTTGSGKSVGINAMILSLLYKAEARDVRLLMIDPKMLEMSVYEGIPHLLAPVVTDMKQAAHGLNWCVAEMERRYKLMSKLGVRNLAGFNAKIDEAAAREEFIYNPFSLTPDSPEPLERAPHIVVIIDELADLMMVVGKKIEELIARLAQKARAAGIHLILATQRPSVDVITGLIKANIPTRIAFQVSSKIDSRTILDQMGAEALLGMGDMLYMPSGTGFPVRVHGAFVSDDEVHRVVAYLKAQGEPNYIEGVLEGGTVDGESTDYPAGEGEGGEKDPMYDQAVEVVLKNRKASISLVQRHLKIGYNRAARLVEDMEKAGLVSSMNGAGQRDILVPARGSED